MGLPGGLEIWVVVLLVLLFFGSKRLPELGSGLGKFISNFKSSYKEGKALDVTPEEEAKKKDEE